MELPAQSRAFLLDAAPSPVSAPFELNPTKSLLLLGLYPWFAHAPGVQSLQRPCACQFSPSLWTATPGSILLAKFSLFSNVSTVELMIPHPLSVQWPSG